MVYLGDNWPDRYRNTVFMNNIHGHRINNDILRRDGSGYTASHGPDLMRSRDPWYMGVTLLYGPDGAVFASDWSDTGECHSVKNTRRETGRIYKISYGKPERRAVDLARLSDEDLVELQLHRNDWHVRHARRLLQERAAEGRDMTHVHRLLHEMFAEQTGRAAAASRAVGPAGDRRPGRRVPGPAARSRKRVPPRVGDSALCAKTESRRVHAMRRLAAPWPRRTIPRWCDCTWPAHCSDCRPSERWRDRRGLGQTAEDAKDQNLPLMIWYGIEPLVHDDLERFVKLCGCGEHPARARGTSPGAWPSCPRRTRA